MVVGVCTGGAAAAPGTVAITSAPSVARIRPRRSVSNWGVLILLLLYWIGAAGCVHDGAGKLPSSRTPSISLRVIAAGPVRVRQPCCCPWFSDRRLVPAQRRLLPGAAHAAARAAHSCPRYSAARNRSCSALRSAW